jgi:hypothetical protein
MDWDRLTKNEVFSRLAAHYATISTDFQLISPLYSGSIAIKQGKKNRG